MITVHILEKGGLGEWLLLGAALGIAFMDKASVLWLVAGLFVAFLATPYRAQLKTIGPWAALALFVSIISPHLLWQSQNGWPTLEFASNAQREKMLPLNPFLFFVQQAVVVNLVAVPFFVAAIVMGFRGELKKWAPLGIAFLFVVAVLIINGKSRINYLAPGYTLVIPLAGLAAQNWIKDNSKKLKLILVALALTSPLYWGFGLPWLSPSKMTWLIERSPIQPLREEKGPKSPMQGWADMFGWQELASGVNAIIMTLPENEQLGAAVVTKNYGEAAALEHFGVTNVICGHNNYYLWGPGNWNGRVAIFVNRWDSDVTGMFESFEQVGTVSAPNAVPEQNGSPIWVARGLKVPVSEFWRRMKKYL